MTNPYNHQNAYEVTADSSFFLSIQLFYLCLQVVYGTTLLKFISNGVIREFISSLNAVKLQFSNILFHEHSQPSCLQKNVSVV